MRKPFQVVLCVSGAGIAGVVAALVTESHRAAINRWVGVVIAVIGAIIMSPSGATELLTSAVSGVRGVAAFARTWLEQVFPFLRRQAHRGGALAIAGGASIGKATATADAWVWPGGSPIEERVEALRILVGELEGRLTQVRNELAQEVADRKSALADLEIRLNGHLHVIKQLIEEREREAARIDARGLPVIGFGVVLCGVPDDLARVPVGWLAPAFGVFLCLTAVMQALETSRSAKSH